MNLTAVGRIFVFWKKYAATASMSLRLLSSVGVQTLGRFLSSVGVQTLSRLFAVKLDIGLFTDDGVVDRNKIGVWVVESGLVCFKFRLCVC
jgi:hypothetical protein